MHECYACLAPEYLKVVVHEMDRMSRSGHAKGLEFDLDLA